MVELIRKIKKKHQREIGHTQDLIVENIYKFFPNAILHEGTFIWRCLQGNRFSEDIDVFISKKDEEIVKKLNFLIKNFEKPLDENELEKIILFRYAPKSAEIIEFLKKWIK